jgi:hypothetical protein
MNMREISYGRAGMEALVEETQSSAALAMALSDHMHAGIASMRGA